MICQNKYFSKVLRFDDLAASVQHCNLCPRLAIKRKVLSVANGSLESRVLFVAEAPGRLGADRTGIPLYGDRTGDNFEALLGNIGWQREQIFITNAILCNPQDDNGTNGTPKADEVANCSVYLEMIVALVQPQVIVTLGATALDALSLIVSHGLVLREAVAKLVPWGDSYLFPLYHPAPRAMVHRSLAKQRADFMTLAKIVHPVKGLFSPKKTGHRKNKPALAESGLTSLRQAVRAFLELGGRMTYFKLTKLLYLTDLSAINTLGHMVAGDVYLRQVEGPWLPRLDQALRDMDGFEVRRFFSHRMPMVDVGPSPRNEVDFDKNTLGIIVEVFQRFGQMNNAEIKAAVYLTAPMQYVLRAEKGGRDMRNKAVLYQGRTIQEIEQVQSPT